MADKKKQSGFGRSEVAGERIKQGRLWPLRDGVMVGRVNIDLTPLYECEQRKAEISRRIEPKGSWGEGDPISGLYSFMGV